MRPLLALLLTALACSEAPTPDGDGGDGGNGGAQSGGAVSAGGRTSSGGRSSSGGRDASGGSDDTGGSDPGGAPSGGSGGSDPLAPGMWDECESHTECDLKIEPYGELNEVGCYPTSHEEDANGVTRCVFFCDVPQSNISQPWRLVPEKMEECEGLGGVCENGWGSSRWSCVPTLN